MFFFCSGIADADDDKNLDSDDSSDSVELTRIMSQPVQYDDELLRVGSPATDDETEDNGLVSKTYCEVISNNILPMN